MHMDHRPPRPPFPCRRSRRNLSPSIFFTQKLAIAPTSPPTSSSPPQGIKKKGGGEKHETSSELFFFYTPLPLYSTTLQLQVIKKLVYLFKSHIPFIATPSSPRKLKQKTDPAVVRIHNLLTFLSLASPSTTIIALDHSTVFFLSFLFLSIF